jgi:hypothetical protein
MLSRQGSDKDFFNRKGRRGTQRKIQNTVSHEGTKQPQSSPRGSLLFEFNLAYSAESSTSQPHAPSSRVFENDRPQRGLSMPFIRDHTIRNAGE